VATLGAGQRDRADRHARRRRQASKKLTVPLVGLPAAEVMVAENVIGLPTSQPVLGEAVRAALVLAGCTVMVKTPLTEAPAASRTVRLT